MLLGETLLAKPSEGFLRDDIARLSSFGMTDAKELA
jgi:hypothetical protein